MLFSAPTHEFKYCNHRTLQLLSLYIWPQACYSLKQCLPCQAYLLETCCLKSIMHHIMESTLDEHMTMAHVVIVEVRHRAACCKHTAERMQQYVHRYVLNTKMNIVTLLVPMLGSTGIFTDICSLSHMLHQQVPPALSCNAGGAIVSSDNTSCPAWLQTFL